MSDLAKAFEHLTVECMSLNQRIADLIRVQGTDMYVGSLKAQYNVINKQREQLLQEILKKERCLMSEAKNEQRHS